MFIPSLYLIIIATFTPTNIVLLSCFAALVGGCASNLIYDQPADGKNLQPAIPNERLFYLIENPFASMLRGFAVSLTFLAGIYITSNMPFSPGAASGEDAAKVLLDQLARANQYARIAGTVSLLAFSVGYDPTLFKRFISMLPQGAKA